MNASEHGPASELRDPDELLKIFIAAYLATKATAGPDISWDAERAGLDAVMAHVQPVIDRWEHASYQASEHGPAELRDLIAAILPTLRGDHLCSHDGRYGDDCSDLGPEHHWEFRHADVILAAIRVAGYRLTRPATTEEAEDARR